MSPCPVIVDAPSVIKRAIFASVMDDFRAGIWTGGIYGATAMLASVLSHVPPPRCTAGPVVAMFDGGIPPHRKAAIPGYKSGREERRRLLTEDQHEKAMAQVGETRKFWETLGVQCAAYGDYEADDAVAAMVRLTVSMGCRPIVVSGDRDLYQTVNMGASMWDVAARRLVDAVSFKSLVGVLPNQYVVYRALVGDSSDSIRGVRGVGPKRAVGLVQEAAGTHGLPSVMLSRIVKHLRSVNPRLEWQQAVIDDEARLNKVIVGIDLSGSFSDYVSLRRLVLSSSKPARSGYESACRKYRFFRFLDEASVYLEPFVRAATVSIPLEEGLPC